MSMDEATNKVVLPQEADYLDMATYTAQRNKLFMAEQMAIKYPEIFSWCDIVLRPAVSPHDYEYEENFANWAIWVDWTWTQTGCTKISCNSRGQGFDCTPESKPFAFRSGDTTWTSCEPACFFRNDLPSTNLGVHSIQTKYHKGKCYWVMNALHAWMTDPTVRSKVKYVRRVNTLATGFDVSYESDEYDIPTIKGRINQYYCDAFFQKLKGVDCEEPWWSDVLGYTFMGQSLVKFLQQAIHPNSGTRDQISLTPDAKSIPSYLLNKHEWKMHIKKDFKVIKPNVLLTDLGFTAIMLTQEKRGHYMFHNKTGIIERFLFYDSVEHVTNRSLSRNQYLQMLSPLQQKKHWPNNDAEIKHLPDGKRKRRDANMPDGGVDDYWDSIGDRFSTTAALLMQMFVQKEFYIQIGTDYSWSLLSRKLGPDFKGVLSKAFSKMSTVLTDNSVRIIDTIAGHLMGQIAADLLVDFSAKFILMMSELAIAGASVIGTIADIALVLDLLVMFGWDPLGMQNQLDSKILNMLREQAIIARYKSGDPNCEVDPMFFTKYILNEKIGTNNTTNTTTTTTNDFLYAHAMYQDTAVNSLQEVIKRPQIYPDQTRFQISSLSDYLNARTANSLGQRYDWDSDIVSKAEDTVARYEIYTHFIPKVDLLRYTEMIKIRQYLSGIIIIVIICFVAFSLVDLFKPLLVFIVPLIWILSYVRFANNEIHNKILENLYRKFQLKMK